MQARGFCLPITAPVVALAAASCWACLFVSVAQGSNPSRFCHVEKASVAIELSGDRRDPGDIQEAIFLANRQEATPGTRIFARIANSSRRGIGYGPEFVIEKHRATGWKIDPSSPDRLWPLVEWILHPGSAGRCYVFDIPADQSRGLYRLSTRVRLWSGKRNFMRVKAPFKIK